MTEPVPARVAALSAADALGHLGQQAVHAAMADGVDYRLVGGHMVRMLLQVYPTPNATQRSTLDADAAVDDVQVVAPFAQRLLDQGFVQERGNLYAKSAGEEGRIEVNLLLARTGSKEGLGLRSIEGVGQVDTLPELSFAMGQRALILEVTAELVDGRIIEYRTKVPGVETAVVLKAHSWRNRRAIKDLADLHSLLEIREAHPEISWQLDASGPRHRERPRRPPTWTGRGPSRVQRGITPR